MEELLELGIDITDIEDMIEVNDEIKDLTSEEIKEHLDILKSIGCSNNTIINIIESNPMYLSRNKEDILFLIKKLLSLNIERLDLTFDNNPWLLNFDDFEIDEYIEKKKKEGKTLEEIIDIIDKGMIGLE